MQYDTLTIRFVDETEIPALLPIFAVINPSNDAPALADTLREMFGQGYRCAVAFEKGQCVGLIGIWIVTKFYIGKHVEYDNFFVRPHRRRQGIGRRMLAFVDSYARQQGCVAAELSCDIGEISSREFWTHLGFGVEGYRYRKCFG